LNVDADMVKYVANLARLELSDEEVSYYQNQLTKVIGYISTLDTEGTDMTNSNLGDAQVSPTVTRPDIAVETTVGITRHSSIKVPRTVG